MRSFTDLPLRNTKCKCMSLIGSEKDEEKEAEKKQGGKKQATTGSFKQKYEKELKVTEKDTTRPMMVILNLILSEKGRS